MGSFVVSANGNWAAAADIQQFVDGLNATTATPVIITGDATTIPLNTFVASFVGGNNTHLLDAQYSTDTVAQASLSFQGGGNGFGAFNVSNGGGSTWSMSGQATQWRTNTSVTTANGTTANGSATVGSAQINGALTASGAITAGSASSLTVTGISSGGDWKTGTGGIFLNAVDTSGASTVDFTAASTNGGSGRGLAIQSTSAANATQTGLIVSSGGAVSFPFGLGFNNNGGSLSGVASFTVSTNGSTVSHGLSAKPDCIVSAGASASGSTETVSSWGTTTCVVNFGSGPVSCIAWKA